MAQIDMPRAELERYRPPLDRPADFDQFWQAVTDEVAALPRDLRLEPVDYPARHAQVFRATFRGVGDAPIVGWYLRPPGDGPFPAIAGYHGYSGNRGEPWNYLHWVAEGYAVLTVDVRGQGGESEDNQTYRPGAVGGWMTRGIDDPQTYFYRDVYGDVVQTVEVLAAQPEVDATRIGTMGGSQGGGLSLAAAALNQRVVATVPDVPFLCHFRRAHEVSDTAPYREFDDYLLRHPHREEQMWRTLRYFDILNFAERVRCPALVSVGLKDLVCPPSTIYAVYNHLGGTKELAVYPAHGHAVPEVHGTQRMAWFKRYLLDA
jgi:cephalosporin-C deacetylase